MSLRPSTADAAVQADLDGTAAELAELRRRYGEVEAQLLALQGENPRPATPPRASVHPYVFSNSELERILF